MKPMQKMEKDSRKDTSISLYPLDFDEAIEMLVQEPKQKDSQTEDSCNTTEPARLPPNNLSTILSLSLWSISDATAPAGQVCFS